MERPTRVRAFAAGSVLDFEGEERGTRRAEADNRPRYFVGARWCGLEGLEAKGLLAGIAHAVPELGGRTGRKQLPRGRLLELSKAAGSRTQDPLRPADRARLRALRRACAAAAFARAAASMFARMRKFSISTATENAIAK